MGNIFGKRKKESQVTEQDKAVLQLKQQRDKMKVYQKKIYLQLEKYRVTAEELLKDGKKEKAKLLLPKKKFRESLLQKSDALLENIERKILSIENVERIMEETQEAVNYQREIDDILAGGLTAEDEDDVRVLKELDQIIQATAEANNLAAVANAKDLYGKEMEKVCGGDKPYLSPEILRQEHERCQTEAMKQFNSIRKMGGEEFSQEYSIHLNVEIESHYDDLLKHNAAKNVYSGIQTPVVLFSCALACYIVSGLLGLLGLEFLANVFKLALFAMLSVAGFWVYTRASGSFVDTGATIDGIASQVLKMFFSRATLHAELTAGDAKKKQ